MILFCFYQMPMLFWFVEPFSKLLSILFSIFFFFNGINNQFLNYVVVKLYSNLMKFLKINWKTYTSLLKQENVSTLFGKDVWQLMYINIILLLFQEAANFLWLLVLKFDNLNLTPTVMNR